MKIKHPIESATREFISSLQEMQWALERMERSVQEIINDGEEVTLGTVAKWREEIDLFFCAHRNMVDFDMKALEAKLTAE